MGAGCCAGVSNLMDTSCSFHLTPQRPPQDTADSLPRGVGAPGDPAGDMIGKGQTRGERAPGRDWGLRAQEDLSVLSWEWTSRW